MKLPPEPPEEIKDLDNLKPIDHAVIALPHTPVYKMHRYFARRPWSVFRELVKHYSNSGSIVLDPFCGGGVTIVEGLALGRKVVGVDFNPLATFVTLAEVVDVNIDDLRESFLKLEKELRGEIEDLYLTVCPKCKKHTAADWFEWANVVECPECSKPVELHRAPRIQKKEKVPGVTAGQFKCYHGKCTGKFRPAQCKRLGDVMVAVHVRCPECGEASEFKPVATDRDLAASIASDLAPRVRRKGLWYPKSDMPDWWDLRRPYNEHIRKFSDLFTSRNLFANALIATYLRSFRIDEEVRNLLVLTFSASLRFTNKMVCRVEGWQSGNPVEWAGATYWLPEVHIEMNGWRALLNRWRAIEKGKSNSAEIIGERFKYATEFSDLGKGATCLVWTGNAAEMPLPARSADCIITDPPYGNNVLYGELSSFYWVWISGILGAESLVDDKDEAIVSKEHKKDLSTYRRMLHAVFVRCHSVLKDNRWMVMTFHNRDFAVWNAIHLAAHDAGFFLPEEDGLIYQPAVGQYTRTIQLRRSGSMLGDFILSFQKAEKLPQQRAIDYVEIGKKIEELAAEAVLHHQGATLSMIYMKLIPFLLNSNLLEKICEREVVPYLKNNFYEKDGVWRLKEKPSPSLDEYLAAYSKNHYKEEYRYLSFIPVEARLEYLIRRLLYDKGSASQDEILNEIYTNLINSNVAEMGEINRVLSRIAVLVTPRKGGRKVWRLTETVEKEKLLLAVEEKAKEALGFSEESTHDLVIRRLVELGAQRSLKAHIGRTEQKKYTEFRRLSAGASEMLKKMKLPRTGLDRVSQIDVLWLKQQNIASAFEVEKTTTIDSGISRFRELFASLQGLPIAAYLVVPKSRESKAREILLSPANVKDSISKKVGYILFEDLKVEQPTAQIDLEKVMRRVS